LSETFPVATDRSDNVKKSFTLRTKGTPRTRKLSEKERASEVGTVFTAYTINWRRRRKE
jgi:hypothetical protein